MSAKPGTASAGLDAAIDELYQAPLDRFTADRNALAAARRKAGERDAADRVKGLPKPGATAWAVNQAWWRDQAQFRDMLEAGEALRAAHLARAGGGSADVRAAAATRQRAVDAVIASAVAALGGPAEVSPDARHRIAGTVEAIASNGMPPDVAPGRLSKDLQSSGLEALSALAGIIAPPAPSRPVLVSRRDLAPVPSQRDQRDTAKAEAAARERAQRLIEAQGRLEARETALTAAVAAEAASSSEAEQQARASLESASARVAELEAAIEQARDDERAARRAVSQSAKTASEAEMVRVRTLRDVGVAREQVAALRPERD